MVQVESSLSVWLWIFFLTVKKNWTAKKKTDKDGEEMLEDVITKKKTS